MSKEQRYLAGPLPYLTHRGFAIKKALDDRVTQIVFTRTTELGREAPEIDQRNNCGGENSGIRLDCEVMPALFEKPGQLSEFFLKCWFTTR